MSFFLYFQGNAKTFFQPPISHSGMFRCSIYHLWRTCPCFNLLRNRRMALCEVVSIHILSYDFSFVYWKHLHDSGNHYWKVLLHKYHKFLKLDLHLKYHTCPEHVWTQIFLVHIGMLQYASLTGIENWIFEWMQ